MKILTAILLSGVLLTPLSASADADVILKSKIDFCVDMEPDLLSQRETIQEAISSLGYEMDVDTRAMLKKVLIYYNWTCNGLGFEVISYETFFMTSAHDASVHEYIRSLL